MAGEAPFKLITVHDDEELVIHAGSGKPAAPADAPAAAVPAQEQAGVGAATAPAPVPGPAREVAADPERDARREELRRRAEELAAAEEGLSGSAEFGRMRTVLLVVVAVVVALIVGYIVASNLGLIGAAPEP